MSHSPLPGPPRSRSTPTFPAPNRNSDSLFSSLLRALHAPLSAHHGHPRTRRVLALEQLKLNGALLLIRCFFGYVGIWDIFTNLLAYLLSTTGAGILSTLFSPGRHRLGLLTVCLEGWILFLIPVFNAADAIWTLRQIAKTSSPSSSGPPAGASAVSHPGQALAPKVSGNCYIQWVRGSELYLFFIFSSINVASHHTSSGDSDFQIPTLSLLNPCAEAPKRYFSVRARSL